jgi:hypothetical protein
MADRRRTARSRAPDHGEADRRPAEPPPLRAPNAPQDLIALQRSAGNAAVGRLLTRKPAPPASAKQDRSKLAVVARNGADRPLDYSAVADESVDWHEREFAMRSSSDSLTHRWRWFDGANTEVDSRIGFGGSGLDFDPDWVRDRIRRNGRAALGTWTVRLEEDDYYDDVEVPVVETIALPELEGMTTQSYYNLRDLPGKHGKLIGSLSGAEVHVRVDSKAKADGIVWYRVSLITPTGKTADGSHSLPAGTSGWMTSDAVTPVIGWDAFIAQLSAWEKAHGERDLGASITVLRRMSHRSDLPFDKVIGRPEGSGYLDKQPFDPSHWKLLNDAQQVRTPDGKIVDMQHLFVGLDVLTNMKEDHSIGEPGLYKLPVGQNYSAATWAGDIGAGAADAAERYDKEWERQKPRASHQDRLDRYYYTRAPDADLLGDIDAWGIDADRSGPGAPRTVVELLSRYYGAPAVQSEYGPSFPFNTSRRKSAVERFISHYGFRLGTTALSSQTAARDGMAKQVKIFGRAWLFRRNAPFRSDHEDEMRAYADDMTDMFLAWLDMLALEVGAGT